MKGFFNTQEIDIDADIIEIEADKLGFFYILGGLEQKNQAMLERFESAIKGEKNPTKGKHYVAYW